MAADDSSLLQLGRPADLPPAGGPVIACVDDGPGGPAAARIAASLGRWLGRRVLLATVQQATPNTATGDDLTPAAIRHSRTLLVRAAGEPADDVESRVLIGEPAQRLLALAEREDAELIVVAAPDQSRMRTMLLGSVYLALAATAQCPVVVVPPGVQRIATTGPIVCGVDGSDVSNTAARVAADFAHRLETRLLLMHASDSLPAAAPGVAGGHGGAGGRRPDAAQILRETADMLRETPPSYLLVERGAPAERLAEVAERESAQLLIIGSRGRGPITSALLGSVASELATSATQPLMIVPPNMPRTRASLPVFATDTGGSDRGIMQCS